MEDRNYEREEQRIIYAVEAEVGSPQTLEERIAATVIGAIHTNDDMARITKRLQETDWKPLIRAEIERRNRRWRLIQERRQALMDEWQFIWKGWCDYCSQQFPRAELMSVTDENDPITIRSSYSQLCASCREKIRATHRKTCVLCGTVFMTEYSYAALSLCDVCATPVNLKEDKRVKTHCWRALRDGLPSSLTLPEWLQTVADFNNLCAYCQTESFSDLEHFIPVHAGGGTTVNNCVPACSVCNTRKNKRHPDGGRLAHLFPHGEIERVRLYLSSR